MQKSVTLVIILLTIFFFMEGDYLLAYDKFLGTYQLNIKDAVTPENAYNAILATSSLNNVQVQSGEVFSFNKVVGKRTPSQGYIVGQLSSRNPQPIYGWGGGICMSSSLLHQAVKASDLPILERHNHLTDTGYLPIGEDAAISWGVEDYRFYNKLPHPLIIKSYIDTEIIRVSLYEQLFTPTIWFAGTELNFRNKPFIEQGTSYVELDESLEKLEIPMKVQALISEQIKNNTIPTYPQANKTYLPLRIIANLSDLEITWKAEKGEICLEALPSENN